MSEWKDVTSYLQGDRAKGREPDAWEAKAGGVRLSVVKGHRDYPDEWICHCYALGMDTVPLGLPGSVAAATAQHAAKNMASHRAREIASAISKIGNAK